MPCVAQRTPRYATPTEHFLDAEFGPTDIRDSYFKQTREYYQYSAAKGSSTDNVASGSRGCTSVLPTRHVSTLLQCVLSWEDLRITFQLLSDPFNYLYIRRSKYQNRHFHATQSIPHIQLAVMTEREVPARLKLFAVRSYPFHAISISYI